MAQQTVLITGASSGIGKAAAKMLAQKGNRVFGGVRHPGNATRRSVTSGFGFTSSSQALSRHRSPTTDA